MRVMCREQHAAVGQLQAGLRPQQRETQRGIRAERYLAHGKRVENSLRLAQPVRPRGSDEDLGERDRAGDELALRRSSSSRVAAS